MFRYGVVFLACGVLTFIAVRGHEPEPPAAAPRPVELVAEGRAPTDLGPRTSRPTAREVVRRSSRRPAPAERPATPVEARAAPPAPAPPVAAAPEPRDTDDEEPAQEDGPAEAGEEDDGD